MLSKCVFVGYITATYAFYKQQINKRFRMVFSRSHFSQIEEPIYLVNAGSIEDRLRQDGEQISISNFTMSSQEQVDDLINLISNASIIRQIKFKDVHFGSFLSYFLEKLKALDHLLDRENISLEVINCSGNKEFFDALKQSKLQIKKLYLEFSSNDEPLSVLAEFLKNNESIEELECINGCLIHDDMQGVRESDVIFTLGQCKNLRFLTLDKCLFGLSTPKALEDVITNNLKKIESFSLRELTFTRLVCLNMNLRAAASIKVLILSGTSVSKDFKIPGNLEVINLSRCQIQKLEFLIQLTEAFRLKEANLSANPISKLFLLNLLYENQRKVNPVTFSFNGSETCFYAGPHQDEYKNYRGNLLFTSLNPFQASYNPVQTVNPVPLSRRTARPNIYAVGKDQGSFFIDKANFNANCKKVLEMSSPLKMVLDGTLKTKEDIKRTLEQFFTQFNPYESKLPLDDASVLPLKNITISSVEGVRDFFDFLRNWKGIDRIKGIRLEDVEFITKEAALVFCEELGKADWFEVVSFEECSAETFETIIINQEIENRLKGLVFRPKNNKMTDNVVETLFRFLEKNLVIQMFCLHGQIDIDDAIGFCLVGALQECRGLLKIGFESCKFSPSALNYLQYVILDLSLREIILRNVSLERKGEIVDWHLLFSHPTVKKLDFSRNFKEENSCQKYFVDIGTYYNSNNISFSSSLEFINLAENEITDFNDIILLAYYFPNLTNIAFGGNPFTLKSIETVSELLMKSEGQGKAYALEVYGDEAYWKSKEIRFSINLMIDCGLIQIKFLKDNPLKENFAKPECWDDFFSDASLQGKNLDKNNSDRGFHFDPYSPYLRGIEDQYSRGRTSVNKLVREIKDSVSLTQEIYQRALEIEGRNDFETNEIRNQVFEAVLHRLDFRIESVSPDGTCFWHSMALLLKLLKNNKMEVTPEDRKSGFDLRQETVKYMRKNKDNYLSYIQEPTTREMLIYAGILDNDGTDEDVADLEALGVVKEVSLQFDYWEHYLDEMAKTSTFADAVEIKATAEYLSAVIGLDVVIAIVDWRYNITIKDGKMAILPELVYNGTIDDTSKIVLYLYRRGDHFDPLMFNKQP